MRKKRSVAEINRELASLDRDIKRHLNNVPKEHSPMTVAVIVLFALAILSGIFIAQQARITGSAIAIGTERSLAMAFILITLGILYQIERKH